MLKAIEELVLALSGARQIAAGTIQNAQVKYKRNYDHKSWARDHRVGDWALIRFPQDETGVNWKLSHPDMDPTKS